MSETLFKKHEIVLRRAIEAIENREFWTPYSEIPSTKIYGEGAREIGENAFKSYLNKPFQLGQPHNGNFIGSEHSPFGFDLGITYPEIDPNDLINYSLKAAEEWAKTSIEKRLGICIEVLDRLNNRSFELGHAGMHTTGQGFAMAFQANGPHANDRGLEALAYAYKAMDEVPTSTYWEKPQGKRAPLEIDKFFTIRPKGIGLVIGCNTFPAWNGYGGIFANLATANTVIIKPHPNAILPLAILVKTLRQVLFEEGLDPNTALIAFDTLDKPISKELARRAEIKLIDFTGGSKFGNWLEYNATQANVYTEKSGVNNIIIDSTNNYKGMCRNIAFSLSLYSGQMCTTPQNIFVPKEGILTDVGPRSYLEVSEDIGGAIGSLLEDDATASEILGGIVNLENIDRLESASLLGDVEIPSRTIEHKFYPNARIHTPLLLKVDSVDIDTYSQELFGPIGFIIGAKNTNESMEIVLALLKEKGGITFGCYSSDEKILNEMEDVAFKGGVSLSENLTAGLFINQSAGFSDYHATGANPAANATLTDAAFIAGRFNIITVRRHAKKP